MNFVHRGCELWMNSLWKSFDKISIHSRLWKPVNIFTLTCGEKSVAALRKK